MHTLLIIHIETGESDCPFYTTVIIINEAISNDKYDEFVDIVQSYVDHNDDIDDINQIIINALSDMQLEWSQFEPGKENTFSDLKVLTI